ncbi:MAG: transposase [Bacteroidales bacterium]|nr:transposase [Bacteroidales bacterium]
MRDILHHCYQRTDAGVVIFYNVSDYLAFFTLFCITARKYRVKVLAMSLMADHIHLSIIEERKGEISAFVREYSSHFARVHNPVCHTKGALFEPRFGCAPKRGDKAARTNLIYVGNNGPERRLCRRAEEYRWNFLAYAISDHPFSEKYIARDASKALRNARSRIRLLSEKNRPLPYVLLQTFFARLVRKEKEQLVDYIIGKYNIIDYVSAIRFFDTYEDMLSAMHASTGSEYDLNEVFIGKSDAHYARMSSLVFSELGFRDVHDVLALANEEKFRIFQFLCNKTDALPQQVAAFLRMPLQLAE